MSVFTVFLKFSERGEKKHITTFFSKSELVVVHLPNPGCASCSVFNNSQPCSALYEAGFFLTALIILQWRIFVL